MVISILYIEIKDKFRNLKYLRTMPPKNILSTHGVTFTYEGENSFTCLG